ncbi:DUF2071 domain-containing protein [Neobacillus sp. PS3-34]|uniref:YqjF family protein n=1 Tax=Neobacillus sp. PS3-34 TaxID=3070678 RepID=UPI0027E16D3D|nr:DUF2071 domain-containing protein [Neobacillus sp. PS3-34]WML46620.1 DUF2071 domain-containing protein [Neobacillus sp. PS3-34]
MKVNNVDHRPWPIPSKPWVMKQTWHDLLFAHWEIDLEIIKPLIPKSLDIDTYEGKAWIGVVPFQMSGIRLRNLPEIPYTSTFPELNVRTYVTYRGEKPGVFFFSLDAANLVAVKTARKFFRLPYYYADILVEKEKETVFYHSKRRDSSDQFIFKGNYTPVSARFEAELNSIDYWLTERYCLYTTHHNRLYRGEISHQPWQLQLANAEISMNSMVDIPGFSPCDSQPLLHYSNRLDVLLWGLEELG